ncbi:hypothetical protein A5740_21740 [Mycobacterium sp. GA-1841]|uniref:hypothetical protein n=1 Tax=Mycobacterium sp. GA-1841 TaxID=1834154 RepID=UPI00096F144D|nr:hypothetical protein [Mycobacterium sp. GA-1841]OMC41726.1 hypothetical protein A5740_21740 [Mycobacterium sp. GA-1841]
MVNVRRCLAVVLSAPWWAMAITPIAAAAPTCTDLAPLTTQCQTGGSTQIVTSPPAMDYVPWYGNDIFGSGGVPIG